MLVLVHVRCCYPLNRTSVDGNGPSDLEQPDNKRHRRWAIHPMFSSPDVIIDAWTGHGIWMHSGQVMAACARRPVRCAAVGAVGSGAARSGYMCSWMMVHAPWVGPGHVSRRQVLQCLVWIPCPGLSTSKLRAGSRLDAANNTAPTAAQRHYIRLTSST